jgi:phosphoglycolate phosphatase-like HAD superfamily hydrolase
VLRAASVAAALFFGACAGSSPPPAQPEAPLVLASASLAPSSPQSFAAPLPIPSDPLPLWNEGAAKSAIISFVGRVTTPGPDFVPVAERIATFDNDGTLWSEQPMYVEFAFALDRVRELGPKHPEWKTKEPFKSVLANDIQGVLATGVKGMHELVMASHAGMTTDDFSDSVKRWFRTATHPKFGLAYTMLVYEPMRQVLGYLRSNGFKTFIVSGGGVDFMRAFTEKTYGIPPEQIIGSTGKLRFELRENKAVLAREPDVAFIDDGPGKAIAIEQQIGRRPIAAFGNSDGDQQMLEWTAAGAGPRLMLLVHHTDAAREVAYDRQSPIGRLDHALDEAQAKGWTVVSMKDDWKTIFPPSAATLAP